MKKTKGSKTEAAFLKLDELSKTVGKKCKVDEKTVRRTLKAAMTAVGQAIEEGERTRVQGLGTFTRTPTKEEGKFRVRFRPQAKGAGKEDASKEGGG